MRRLVIALLLLSILVPLPLSVAAQTSVVRAVFFFSPTCPHCEKVMAQDLPPLADEYGEQLRVLYVDVTTTGGQSLYQSAIQSMAIPENRLGVPTLIVGEQVLVGSLEIPQQFPTIIERGLADDGIDWPAISGLPEVLASIGEESQPQEASPQGVIGRIARDPLGNGLSIVVLLAMVASAGLAWRRWHRWAGVRQNPPVGWQTWLTAGLILLGAAISGYLAFVETNPVEAVCGPIGDCNTVNSSRYAFLFGVLPVGIMGLFGYLAIGLAWLVSRSGEGRSARQAGLVLGGMTAVGFVFSLYLTFLEPFVIGATCAWCLSSAIIMTALFLLHIGPARMAYDSLR